MNWSGILWRFSRGTVATAATQAAVQTLLFQANWSDPRLAFKTLLVSFISGFLLALSKGIRDLNANPILQKLPV